MAIRRSRAPLVDAWLVACYVNQLLLVAVATQGSQSASSSSSAVAIQGSRSAVDFFNIMLNDQPWLLPTASHCPAWPIKAILIGNGVS